MYLKPRIFIGSSKESINIAHIVKERMEPEYECVIWTDNFFKSNKSTYESLVKQSICFDYAIFIGGKDDRVKRLKFGTKKLAPRDNVYLEFGLYAGGLSAARCYFFAHESITIASDLMGITLYRYKSIKNVENNCVNLKALLKEEDSLNRIRLLPSTSLAIGYFRNFLEPACNAIFNIDRIDIKGKKYKISKYKTSIELIIPDSTDENWKDWAVDFYLHKNAENITLESGIRGIGMKMDYELFKNNKEIKLWDIPQTLRAAFQSVDLVLGKDYIGSSEFIKIAKRREVDNFVRTLVNLIKEKPQIRKITKIHLNYHA